MERLFIQILNMSISAGWLILAVTAARFLLKKAPRRITALLWGLAALRLILPDSVPSALSLLPSAETLSPSLLYAEHPAVHSGIAPLDRFVNPVLGEVLAADPFSSVNPAQVWAYVGACVWIAGLAVFLLYGALSFLLLCRTTRESVPYRGNIRLCDHVGTPFILGVFRPRIILPSEMGNDPDSSGLAYVLAHENAHLRRKDHLWKPLGFLLLSVYWFSPPVWIAYILFCRDIEAACDESVIRDLETDGKKAYAHALVSYGTRRTAVSACPLAFGESAVRDRVKMILKYRKPALWITPAAALLCLAVAVCFMTNPTVREPDLSFLNYKNAVSLIAENGIEYAISYPAEDDSQEEYTFRIGTADAPELARYLSRTDWRQRNEPWQSLSSPGSVEFVIENDYRITVYQKPRIARVRFHGQDRFYRTGRGDYEAALALLRPRDPDTTQMRPDVYTTILDILKSGRRIDDLTVEEILCGLFG